MSEKSNGGIHHEGRPDAEFNQKPTGHIIPEINGAGRSPDDPGMTFFIPDCGVKAGGQFMDPVNIDEHDLPGCDCACCRNRQGF